MNKRKFFSTILSILVILSFTIGSNFQARATNTLNQGNNPPHVKKGKITPADRKAAAQNRQALMAGVTYTAPTLVPSATGGLVPDYYGPVPNWALSPMPTVDPVTLVVSGGI